MKSKLMSKRFEEMLNITGIPSHGLVKDSQLERGILPAVGTQIVDGAFVIVDMQLRDGQTSELTGAPEILPLTQDSDHQGSNDTNSFVDIAFGQNTSTFSGCHRFEIQHVKRLPEASSQGSASHNVVKANFSTQAYSEGMVGRQDITEGVRVIYSCFACDPVNRERRFPWALHYFHMLYARWLFWDGVRRVVTLQ